jgi:trans-aconitate 2-methyltransferase
MPATSSKMSAKQPRTGEATHSREWDSTAYHRISAPQFSWGRKILDRLSLSGDETVLDAGCGTGKLTRELLELLPDGHVVALDVSRNMLSAAQANLASEFGDRVEFVAADLMDLPFSELFDGIFSTAAFHWVPDHDRLFQSLYRALKSGGWLIAQCGGARNLDRFLGRVAVLTQVPEFSRYLSNFQNPWVFSDAQTARRMLEAVGFIEVETSVEEARTRFDTAEQFSEFASKVILHRHLELLPDEELRRRMLDQLAEEAAHDDPPFELDYWRLNLKAKKPGVITAQ